MSGGGPHKWSSKPCPTGDPAISDGWVGFTGGASDDDGLAYVLCPQCLNWHTQTQIEARAAADRGSATP